ncbi:MAG: alkaline phosphatase family protein, partial [Solirubrobacterales bacterium]
MTWYGRPAHGLVSLMLATSLALAVAIQSSLAPTAAPRANAAAQVQGMFKLDHLIFIVQENRSFDHYFGTYPGADGLPIDPVVGEQRACIPDPVLGGESCTYHSSPRHANGGPHNWQASAIDVNGGAMDGFVTALPQIKRWCVDRASAECSRYVGPDLQPDVLSWKDRRDIPNYWTYADRFVLHDHMFAPADSWTLPA